MTESPCINICQMVPASGLCRGCWRTINEITRWSRCNETERQQIMAAIAHRQQENQQLQKDPPA